VTVTKTSQMINSRVRAIPASREIGESATAFDVNGFFDSLAVTSAPPEKVEISILIPLLNEVENLELLYQQVHETLEQLGKPYEIIFVDDGSTDGSYELLREFHAQDSQVRVIRFRRNFGQTAAFAAGFELASGDVIITLDADLQNDPNDIPKLLEKLDEGYDIVSGWRIQRKDKYLTRRVPSQAANALISKLTGVKLHDYGCSLKAYRKDVVKNIKLYGEMHRFIPALASWMGVRVAEIPVNHRPRQFGQSKYGLQRTVKVFLDLLTVKFLLSFGTRPIHVFGLLGMLCFAGGILSGAYLSVLKLFYGQPLADRPLLLLTVLLTVLGVQFITMGLLGELVVRTYHESQKKSTYMIRDLLHFQHMGHKD
jgi:glycosyltransferase involved in cell wall biosynthesis